MVQTAFVPWQPDRDDAAIQDNLRDVLKQDAMGTRRQTIRRGAYPAEIMSDQGTNKMLLEYRKKHFAVRITPSRYPEEDGQIDLSTTINGFQWTTISLLKSEVAKVIEALQNSRVREL